MIVTMDNLDKVLAHLEDCPVVAVDTETTGLRPYHGDVLFAIIISTKDRDFYFNFNTYERQAPLCDSVFDKLAKFFEKPELVCVMHNAKFDLSFLKKEGIEIKGTVLDLWAMDRLKFNDHFSYSLDAIAKRNKLNKLDIVEEYIRKNKMYEYKQFEHKRVKLKKYNEVPFEIIAPYGERDGRITYDCYSNTLEYLQSADQLSPINLPKQLSVLENEASLTKVLGDMESIGVMIDVDRCKLASNHYVSSMDMIEQEFKQLTGHDYAKSPKLFAELFKDERIETTDKGNFIFDASAMKRFKHPAARLVLKHSEYKKQLDYYTGFLYHCDENSVIHTNFKQAGTATGRLSSSEPNLQNLTKPDKYEAKENEDTQYPIRGVLVPRPGYFFAMLDFDQMEYRMMLDMAGANNLIDSVLGGLDVHQATADIAGITRQEAKTVNFSVLYGSGLDTLGKSLGTDREGARAVRDSIFRAAPEIRDFIRRVTRTAEQRGYIFNWLGRRSYFPRKEYSYKAPNYLIQGGTADVVKVAMNQCFEFLKDFKSRLLLTIHDELVFEIAIGEEHILHKLASIMENVYPAKRLKLTCGIEHSFKSLADKVEGIPVKSGDG